MAFLGSLLGGIAGAVSTVAPIVSAVPAWATSAICAGKRSPLFVCTFFKTVFPSKPFKSCPRFMMPMGLARALAGAASIRPIGRILEPAGGE